MERLKTTRDNPSPDYLKRADRHWSVMMTTDDSDNISSGN